MPSLSNKNETKRKAHELKRAGLAPRKEPKKSMSHEQKKDGKEVMVKNK
jgi:hypothetical protein